MGRNKFKGKRGDYGQNQNNATSFVKVIHRPRGKVAGQYVEVVVLVLQDALEDAAKDEEERRRSRGIVGTADLTSATGADTVYEFDFDTSKVLSEMAIFRHKGFKTLGPGSHGGSKSHVPGLGGRCTKVELVDMYGSPDMETCLRAIVSEQIIKLLRLRAKAATRAEALAVGAGNREWRGSALGPAHRFYWSIQSHTWMSAERQDWVEMIFAIVIRLRCLAEQNLDKLDARESADATDPAAAAEAAKAFEAAEAENGGGPLQIACLRGKKLFSWLPNEMWVHILSHIRRSNIGPNDTLASIQLATGGGKLKIGHVPSGCGKMRARVSATSEDGNAAPVLPLSHDGGDGYDAGVLGPGSRATSGRASSDAAATTGTPFEQEAGPAVPVPSSTRDHRPARDHSAPAGPSSGPAGSEPRRSKPDGATADDDTDVSGPSAPASGAAKTDDDWGPPKRCKGKGKGKRGKKGNKRWDEEEDEAEAAAASGSAASKPAPPTRGGKGKAAKGKKNKKGRRWDEEDDDEEAAAAAAATVAAAPEHEGVHSDDDDMQLGRSEEKTLSKTAKKAKRREQRAARAQAFDAGDSIFDGEGDIDATLDAMIMGGGKKGKKKKKNSGVRQNYDHAPGGAEEESGGATIPCDVCGKQVPLMLFVAHSEECNARIQRDAAADQALRGPDDA